MRLQKIDEENEEEWIDVYENIASRLHDLGTPMETQHDVVEISQDVFDFLEMLRNSDVSKYTFILHVSQKYDTMDLESICKRIIHENYT